MGKEYQFPTQGASILPAVLYIVAGLVLFVGLVLFQCYMPCDFWSGSLFLTVPGRCIQELSEPR